MWQFVCEVLGFLATTLGNVNALAVEHPVIAFLCGALGLRGSRPVARLAWWASQGVCNFALKPLRAKPLGEIESIVLADLASARFIEGGAGELRGKRVTAQRRRDLTAEGQPPVSVSAPDAVEVYLLNPHAGTEAKVTGYLSRRSMKKIAHAIDAARVEHDRIQAELECERVKNLLVGVKVSEKKS